MNTNRTSIHHNEAFAQTLNRLIEAEAEAAQISETNEPARFDAQQNAVALALDALHAIVDAHTAQAIADALKPAEAEPTEELPAPVK